MAILLPALIAFLITLAFVPVTIKLAKRFGLVDDPQTHNHPAVLHKKCLPRAGGLPIFIGILIATVLFIPPDKHLIGVLLGAVIIVADGLLDDKFDLHPAARFFTQFAAAGIVVLFGVGVTYITNPFGGIIRLDVIDIPVYIFGEHHLYLLADIFAVLWIIWTMNMVNWSAGVDGQMPGFVVVAAVTLAVLAIPFTSYDPYQWIVIKLCLIVAGSTLAFLIFNWHPAKILPGDSASMLLGFLLAVIAIFSGGKMATAVIVLGIPTLDALWAIIRRVARGRLPIWGDKEHLHHHLLRLGLTHRQIAVVYWMLALILGVFAVTFGGREKLWLFLVLAGMLAFFLILITKVLPKKPEARS